jgi:hypothetical protein
MKRRRHGAPILEQNVSECSPSAPVGEIDNPLAGTRPLFEERAKIVTARSISSASRTSIGLTSTPNADGFIFFAMASGTWERKSLYRVIIRTMNQISPHGRGSSASIAANSLRHTPTARRAFR